MCILVCVYECIEEFKCLIGVRVCLFPTLCVCFLFRCLILGAGRELLQMTPISEGETGRLTTITLERHSEPGSAKPKPGVSEALETVRIFFFSIPKQLIHYQQNIKNVFIYNALHLISKHIYIVPQQHL